jgi:Putative addiction module component
MEIIWDDLSRDEEKFESPSWHESILNERKEALSGGTHKHSDWTEAKERIKSNVSYS